MPKFCPTCGKQLPFEEAEVCPGCGVRINEPSQKKSSDSSLSKGLLIIAILGVVLVVVLIGSAVIAAFVFGMSGSSTVVRVTPEPVYTTKTPPAPTVLTPSGPQIIVLSRPSVQGWNWYTVPGTQNYIYIPKDWTTTSKPMSYGGKDYTFLISYSPDMTTAVGAFAVDVTGILGGQTTLEKILSQGYIGSDMYQGVISGLTSGSTSDPVTNIVQDPTYYSISGHPARKIEYDQMNAHLKDYVVVVDRNTVIMELMMTSSQATYDDRTNADASLRSLTG
jgi:hypothetical protein